MGQLGRLTLHWSVSVPPPASHLTAAPSSPAATQAITGSASSLPSRLLDGSSSGGGSGSGQDAVGMLHVAAVAPTTGAHSAGMPE